MLFSRKALVLVVLLPVLFLVSGDFNLVMCEFDTGEEILWADLTLEENNTSSNDVKVYLEQLSEKNRNKIHKLIQGKNKVTIKSEGKDPDKKIISKLPTSGTFELISANSTYTVRSSTGGVVSNSVGGGGCHLVLEVFGIRPI